MPLKKIFQQRDMLGYIVILVLGALIPFAFAPHREHGLLLHVPAIAFLLWASQSPKQAFLRGLCFGIGIFGFGTSWVYISIHEFGGTPMIVAGLITALFVLVLALFPAIHAYLVQRFFPTHSAAKWLIAMPALWVLMEWMRSWFFTGFPWLLIAHSTMDTPLKGYVPILGEYGVGFLAILMGTCLIYAVQQKGKQRYLAFGLYIVIGLGGVATSDIQWVHPLGKAINVSLIQGNIPQSLKWDRNQIIPTLNTYVRLTEEHWNSDLIVWPESAVPVPKKYVSNFIQELDEEAKKHNSTLLLGIPIDANDGEHYYNGLIALGNGSGEYYKRHLVPFGEYIPLMSIIGGVFDILNIPISGFKEGTIDQANLTVDGIQVAPFICYEIAYAPEVLESLPEGQLMVTVSNDAWFGESNAPAQHLEIAQFRALQAGRYHLFSTNNGITAIIGPKGQLVKTAPPFKATVLNGTVQAMQGSTPWLSVGNLPILLTLITLLAIGYIRQRRCNVSPEMV